MNFYIAKFTYLLAVQSTREKFYKSYYIFDTTFKVEEDRFKKKISNSYNRILSTTVTIVD